MPQGRREMHLGIGDVQRMLGLVEEQFAERQTERGEVGSRISRTGRDVAETVRTGDGL